MQLCKDQRGVSAVEFAILLPLMLTLYLGAVEISQAVAVDRKVTLTSHTLADLAAQVSTISSSDMSNILNASTSVITPYDASRLKVTVSQVSIDANNNAKVTWSCTLGGTARAIGSTVTLPTALNVANTSLIWGEAAYSYKPAIGYVVTGTLNLSDQIYMRPRLTTSVSASC
jgi:Flp pilus assembly protein TadG